MNQIILVSGKERKMSYVGLLTDDELSITVPGPQMPVSLALVPRRHDTGR